MLQSKLIWKYFSERIFKLSDQLLFIVDSVVSICVVGPLLLSWQTVAEKNIVFLRVVVQLADVFQIGFQSPVLIFWVFQ